MGYTLIVGSEGLMIKAIRREIKMKKLNPVEAKLAEMTVEQVFDVALALKNDFREGTDVVFAAANDQLFKRLPADEYIRISEQL